MQERKKASDFPQELLNLFDKYVHGDIERRDFLEGAKKFAVGGVTATMLFESLRPNYAWAQQVPKDDKRIVVETATAPSPQGNGSIKGEFVKPANAKGKLPGVLVVHENRGLNPYIEDVARRLATENFLAFAPDGLTSVGGYPGTDEEGAKKFPTVDGNKMTEDFVAAAQWLKARPDCNGKIGVVGFCYGGGIANKLAVRMGSDLAAAVPFYGAQPPAADVHGHRLGECRHPGAACRRDARVRERVPALSQPIALAVFLEAARAIGSPRRQLLLAVAGDDVAPPIANCARRLLRLGAVGDHVTRADAAGGRNAEFLRAGTHCRHGPQVGVGSTEDEQRRLQNEIGHRPAVICTLQVRT